MCSGWQGWTCLLNLNVISYLLDYPFSEDLNSENLGNQMLFSYILMSQGSVMHMLPRSDSDLWDDRQLFFILSFMGRHSVKWNVTKLYCLMHWWFTILTWKIIFLKHFSYAIKRKCFCLFVVCCCCCCLVVCLFLKHNMQGKCHSGYWGLKVKNSTCCKAQ